jgi:hypothetical protein
MMKPKLEAGGTRPLTSRFWKVTVLWNQRLARTLAPPVRNLKTSLDAFRPLAERAPEPQIAEAQRREFFQQLHRWLRQDYAVHVFCNNDGERQRFEEIWKEHGFTAEARLVVQTGSLARGFICDEAKLVVVTDAEIFGRYKIQRPRRQKSLHALAARSALDIDFTDLEESDLVVHLQHGIGRYLGLKLMPAAAAAISRQRQPQPSTSTECLVIEYAPANSGDESAETLRPRQRGASRQQIRRRGQGESAAEHARRHALGEGEGADRTRRARHRGGNAPHPGRARNAGRPCVPAGHAMAARI